MVLCNQQGIGTGTPQVPDQGQNARQDSSPPEVDASNAGWKPFARHWRSTADHDVDDSAECCQLVRQGERHALDPTGAQVGKKEGDMSSHSHGGRR
jgi:hypothetical protein